MLLRFLLSLGLSESLYALIRRPRLNSIEPLLFCFRLAEMASGPEQSSVPTSSNSSKNRVDPGWKYVDPAKENSTNDTICKFCSKLMKGGITRAKEHLIGKSGNVSKCSKVPEGVKEELIKYMKQKKRQCSEEVDLENLGVGLSEEGAEGIDDIPNPRPRVTKRARALKGPTDLAARKPETAIGRRNKAKLRQQNIREACDKEVVERVHQYPTQWQYQAGISFNCINSHKLPSTIDNLVSVVSEQMKLQSDRNLEEIHRMVKKEVELALKQTSGKERHTFESRSLQLQFENNISLPVYTGARIEGEDGSNLRIVLVDVLTGKVVSSGSESLAKVEIVVLEGDFEDDSEIWMPEEFRSNIVREREGKKPLLTGDVILYLKDGTGMVGKISFTDNSSWTRSHRFRLGAKVVDNFDGVRMREAKTESFIVRDHRGKLSMYFAAACKKHHPPNLFDEVWRLENIGKDGAFHQRLSLEKIYTVKDFLTLLNLDPSKLRKIVGTGMSAKMWELTVEHARSCTLDTTRHLYFPSHSEQKTGVVFSAVGQGEKFSSCDDEASLMDGSLHFTNVLYSSNPPNTEGSSANKLLAPQETRGPHYTQASASSPDIRSSIYSVGGTGGFDGSCMPNFDGMGRGYDQNHGFPVQVTNTDPMGHAFDEDYQLFFHPDLQPQCYIPAFDEDHLQLFDNDLQSECHIADLPSPDDGFMMSLLNPSPSGDGESN